MRRPAQARTCRSNHFPNIFIYIDIGGTDSRHRVCDVPELRCVKGTGDFDNIRGLAGGWRLTPVRIAKRSAGSRSILGKASVLKVLAAIVSISMLSTIIPSSGGFDQIVRATAAPTIFGTPVMINNNKANDQAAPVSILASGNELYVVWQDARSGDEDIYASMTYDGGATFAPNKRADDALGVSMQIEPATAVSSNGTIMLAWQDNRRSTFDFDIYFTKSYDGGNKYTPNLRVDDSFEGISWQERPSIAVAAGGTTCVAWTDDRAGPGQVRVRYAYSIDGGASFSPSAELVSGGGISGQTGVSLTSNGNRIFAVFLDNVTGSPHPYLCVSIDGGRTFMSPARLDDTGNSSSLQNGLTVAPMPGGGVVVAWEDSRNGDWDIYATIVAADGKMSASNIRVDDDSSREYQRGTCVASDQLGNIYVVWEDDRDQIFAIRFAYLEVGRTRFNASIEVATPGNNDMQRRPSVIATQPGRVFVIWQDDKSGTYDVYASTAYFRDLFAISLVKGWNFVSIPTTGFAYNASTLGLLPGDIVSGWNPATQTYDKNYVVGLSPPIKDFAVADSTGYMIFASADEKILLDGSIPTVKQYRLISVPAKGGWVTLGLESLSTAKYASDIPKMFSTSGGVTMVISHNPATGAYKAYIPGMAITDFALVPGQAYWMRCAINGVLAYTP